MKINVDLEDILAVVESDENIGFCIECGAESSAVEPDTEKRRCETCGKYAVYGAEQLLIYL